MIEFFATACILVLPGAFLFTEAFGGSESSVIERLPTVITASLAIWIIGFWFLAIIPVPLALFVPLVLIASLILFWVTRNKEPKRLTAITRHIRTNVGMCIFFAALAVPFIVMAQKVITPMGQDMSMHAYLARAMLLADGFPKTLRPLVPIDQVGIYPLGFPIVIAILSTVNKIPVYTNALIVTALTYWLVPAALFTLLRKKFTSGISAITAVLVTWTGIVPFNILGWGSNPTVLSFVFLVMALALLLEKPKPLTIGLSFAFAFTSVLTHYMMLVACLYFLVALLPFTIGFMKQSFRKKNLPRALTILMLIAVIPFLWNLRNYSWYVTPETKAYVAGLQQADLTASPGDPGWVVAASAIQFMATSFDAYVWYLYVGSLIVMILLDKKYVWTHIASLITMFLLIVNSRYWVLPFSPLLYPDRIIPLFLIPLSLGIAEGCTLAFAWIYKTMIVHSKQNHQRVAFAGILVLAYWFAPVIQTTYFRIMQYTRESIVTESDLAAFQWLQTHTKRTDVIMNNYYDAGVWIPAIAGRPITHYHTNPIDQDRLLANTGTPTYVYIGDKSLLNTKDAAENAVSVHPDAYTLMYRSGNAKIYRILNP